MLGVRSGVMRRRCLARARWLCRAPVRLALQLSTATPPSSTACSRARRGFARVAVPFAVLSAVIAAAAATSTSARPRPRAGARPLSPTLRDDLALLLRSGTLLGAAMYHRGEFSLGRLPRVPVAGVGSDDQAIGGDVTPSIVEMLRNWRDCWLSGGARGFKAELVGRLADAVIAADADALSQRNASAASNAKNSERRLLRLFAGYGALSVLLQFVASEKPTDRHLTVQLVRAIEILLETTERDFFDDIGADLRLPLPALGSALGHLVEQDAVLFTDLLRLGDALLACRDKALQLGGQRGPRTFSLRGIQHSERGLYSQSSGSVKDDQARRQDGLLRDACAGLTRLCSPEMPRAVKLFSLWALTSILQAVDRNGAVMAQSREVEEVLSPHFAALMLALPRGDMMLSMQAAELMDVMLRLAQQNATLASRDTFDAWMKLVRQWTGTMPLAAAVPTRANGLRGPVSSIKAWRSKRQHNKDDSMSRVRDDDLSLRLQLVASRCLRTMSNHPLTCRYLRESPETRVALFELTRRVHERSVASRAQDATALTPEVPSGAGQRSGGDAADDWDAHEARSRVDDASFGSPGRVDANEVDTNIQVNVSRAFRNICRSFQSGRVALESLFAATWTASLLQSRRSLPMSHFFRNVSDLTELPVVGADEYEASTEFGWIDMLTTWIASPRHELRENAIDTLTFLAEQRGGSFAPAPLTSSQREDDVSEKQDHILQAWLTSMLQHVRLVSGGEILAVRQMEQTAKVSDELTPGNEKVLFNPAVVDAGTSAVAVLAQRHHDELVRQGVVPLMALLSASPAASQAQQAECARVLANLVATCCQDLDATRPAFAAASPPSVVSGWEGIWRHCVAEHFDVEQLLSQTQSGRHVLRELARWREQTDPMQRSHYYRVMSNLQAYRALVTSGRLTRALYCEGVHPIVGSDTQVGDGEQGCELDIVFVHGLRGHPFGTWRADMGSSIDASNDVWPDALLRPDLEAKSVRARLVTLGYEAGMVSWSSPWPSLSLQERARVMLDALDAANIGRARSGEPAEDGGAAAAEASRPVIFVAHSMGGLLVKKMLLLSSERGRRGSRPTLAESTEGVVFLAVPHFGSALANGVRSESVRSLVQTHPAIQDLAADEAHGGRLAALNEAFARLGIDCLSMGEDRAAPLGLGLSAVVVAPQSADPGVGRFRLLPGSDHMTICKAKTGREPMYREVLAYILERPRPWQQRSE